MPPPSLAFRSSRPIALWLFVVAAMVFAMVVLGGVTRLTGSGLSMVEWRPLVGWLPPMGEAEWQALFAKYRAFPEYQKVNAGMTLAGFKSIFWLEYLHRTWGRLIGVAFFAPFVYFLLRRSLPAWLWPHLAVMLVLGALQGGLGWYMVMSGLIDRPEVSQYRLAAHLALAVLIYGYMFWVALGILDPRRGAGSWHAPAPRVAALVLALLAVTMISGAFVAGTDAGLIYNTFPLMGDGLVPADLIDPKLQPAMLNFFEHRPAIQFDHRVMALVTVTGVAVLMAIAYRRRHAPRVRFASLMLLLAVAAQAGLGIATLLAVVPVWLAALHQAGALALFTVALWTLHEFRAARAAVFG